MLESKYFRRFCKLNNSFIHSFIHSTFIPKNICRQTGTLNCEREKPISQLSLSNVGTLAPSCLFLRGGGGGGELKTNFALLSPRLGNSQK